LLIGPLAVAAVLCAAIDHPLQRASSSLHLSVAWGQGANFAVFVLTLVLLYGRVFRDGFWLYPKVAKSAAKE
jgi:hypothetical protein